MVCVLDRRTRRPAVRPRHPPLFLSRAVLLRVFVPAPFFPSSIARTSTFAHFGGHRPTAYPSSLPSLYYFRISPSLYVRCFSYPVHPFIRQHPSPAYLPHAPFLPLPRRVNSNILRSSVYVYILRSEPAFLRHLFPYTYTHITRILWTI
ncbi:hypothetical protein EXIGLDRAFT_432683 [Exidia glandulosa HHB12029]|uniref:Uncharacterized protein n=1 Tax=Exidia glandulosa HHB12029 TaxID=1314781 RepID=A0A165BA95_EXIGL|nr:hypothetical protein EXIGLDRAFT_432683 [Exidia glandulosa HHB12029]